MKKLSQDEQHKLEKIILLNLFLANDLSRITKDNDWMMNVGYNLTMGVMNTLEALDYKTAHNDGKEILLWDWFRIMKNFVIQKGIELGVEEAYNWYTKEYRK